MLKPENFLLPLDDAPVVQPLPMINLHNEKQVLATVTAFNKKENWPVRIEKRSGYFSINGRWSVLDLYLFDTPFGYLVSIPNYNLSGLVPAYCTPNNIHSYVGLKNRIDAITLATGVKWLIENKHAYKHPYAEKTTIQDHCQSCGRDFVPGEVVYFAPLDNNIICDVCARVHRNKEPRRYQK